MADLFERRCVVIVEGLRVEGLRTSFKVAKTSSKQPNTLDLAIYNLSPESRGSLKKKGALVQLEAGYRQDVAMIFQGNARLIDHKHEGSDWITRVQCGDGEVAYQNRTIYESHAAGVSTVALLKRLISTMGVEPGNAIEAAQEAVRAGRPQGFANGYVFEGRCSYYLDKLFKTLDLPWSIQNGALFVPTEKQQTVFEFSPDNGLVGSPEQGVNTATKTKEKKTSVKAKVLLCPSLRIGSMVSLRSAQQKGIFVIQNLGHSGDTHGGEWYSEFEATPTTKFVRVAA